ncbi:MAG: major capsid protein [Phycisphaeraceae bacterium]|nr:major capsid protein [Phycisphaeraceae bacterium]
MLDIFNNNAFSAVSMTQSINILPHQPRRIEQMGLFDFEGISTTTAVVGNNNGQLSLLPTKARGDSPTQMSHSKKNVRAFPVPHIPAADVISPGDVQNLLALPGSQQMAVAATLINQRMTTMRSSMEATIEHLKIGAVKGNILDSDGTSVLFNLFTEFGISETAVDFVLGTATTNIKNKCLEVARGIETVLGSETYDHIHCLCSSTFFDKLTSHAKVTAAYERWQNGDFLRADNRRGFTFASITFEEYRGKVGSVDFIPAGDARFFPVGVMGLFKHFAAPGNS